MQAIKKSYLIITSIACAIGFIIPFFLKSNADSWNAVLSASFTVVSSLITIAAIIITILLFDRYGVNAKFKQKQIDQVLELSQFLKDSHLHAKNSKSTYIIQRRRSYTKNLNELEYYVADSRKEILFSDDFLKFLECLYVYTTSDWLPQEIKNKLKFIDIKCYVELDTPEKEVYIRMFIKNEEGVWSRTFPKLTFEMFNINLSNLLEEIDSWLKRHSDIPANQFT